VIDDGPKAKVKEVDFVGNEVFSDAALAADEDIRPARLLDLGWLLGKKTYTPRSGRARRATRSGWRTSISTTATSPASVGEPKVVYLDGKTGKKSPRASVSRSRSVKATSTASATVKFEGMTIFKPELVLPIFKLQTGDVYKESKIKKGFDKLRDAYGAQGYFQWTGGRSGSPTPSARSWTSPSPWTRTRSTTSGRSRSRATPPPATR
jgi:hypothetical protein